MGSTCFCASAQIGGKRLAAMLLLCFALTPAWAVDLTRQVDFHIGPQRLSTALLAFSHQAKVQIIAGPEVGSRKTGGVSGMHSIADGLATLLDGSSLEYRVINDTSITVGMSVTRDSGDAGKTTAAPLLDDNADAAQNGSRLAQLDHGSSTNAAAPAGDVERMQPEKSSSDEIDEIIVTGTHIRGVSASASETLVYTREDIDATGAISVQQFLQTLPQNFTGASESQMGAIAYQGSTNNTVNGSAPNLRGLGADATLVLIDGHRVAPGNSDGAFVDISMIPLAAVERIEIVTDGASAIYGADAVGGVVNIILRSKFEGAESRVQYGSVTKGSMHDIQASQTVGHEWAGGSGIVSYQYSDQTPLSAASRDYLQGVPLPFELLPEQVQQAVFATARQEVTSDIDVHGDAVYSRRYTYSTFTAGDPAEGVYSNFDPALINSYSTTLGSTVKLPRHSELALLATYSETDTNEATYQTSSLAPSEPPLDLLTKTKSAIISLDANLDGVLATMPSGAVHYAVGAQYRKESYGNTFLVPLTDNTFYPSRKVDAGYAELRIPVLGQRSEGSADPVLEFTAADRAEHYSDFGSTNNPQFGAIWKPSSSLTVRATQGTSFKAPLLSELDPVPAQVVPFPGALFNPVPGGPPNPNTLIVDGGNPNLKPEKATHWTVGLDFKPVQIEGLSSRLTYYDIIFRNEIVTSQASVNTANIFLEQAILGPILERNPSMAAIDQWISYPTYLNPFGVNPATITALLDDRYLNSSTASTRGLDFGLGYKTTLSAIRLDTGIDGNYILAFNQQFTSTAPNLSVLNTTYNPTSVRLRGRTIVGWGPLSAGLYLNFTNAYTNINVVPGAHVSSWTTADAILSYESAAAGGPLKGFSAALSVTNLTDRDPPYVANPNGYSDITYDGANANALGRYLSLRLQKRW
jgi:outer membrane receptor protein involved in Fe transport